MNFKDSLHCFGDKKFLLAFMGFPASFLFIFYSTLCFFVTGFTPEVPYVLLNFFLFALLTATAVFSPGFNSFYLFLVYFILLAPILITTSYIAIYEQPMSGQSFFFLWETNIGESMEFIRDALARSPRVIFFPIVSILLPLLPLVSLVRRRKWLREMKPLHRYVSAVVCFFMLLWLCVAGKANFNVAYQFYHSFFSYRQDAHLVYLLSGDAAERIKEISIASSRGAGVKETYIVVIGESASRHHMGLYGYSRATDPRMAALYFQKSLIAFDNVNAINTGTTRSLMHALSFKDQFTPFSTFQFSVVDVFNAANFKTYWLSNNAVLLYHDTILQSLSRNASVRKFTETRNADVTSLISTTEGLIAMSRDRAAKTEEKLTFDEELLPWVDEALSSGENKKIIFVHIKGSHILYWYRFPNAFERFKSRDGISPKTFLLDDREVEVINDYDNSIYYTDYILNELVKKLESTEGESWLLYFSDHGEEMYDFRRKMGRSENQPNRYVLDVPFLVWFSRDYKKIRDIETLKGYRDRPFDLDSLIYAIMDLANLKTELLDKTRSIFSDKYQVPARMVIAEPYFTLPPLELRNNKTLSDEIKAVESFFLMKSQEER